MKKRGYLALALLAALVLGLTVFALTYNQGGTGYLEGKITIGPLCPVERNPPDPNCLPTAETYKAWPIAVWTPGKIILAAQIETGISGTYKIALPAGSYVVDLERQSVIGARNLPANIDIRSGQTTVLDINIDTGIR